MITFRFAGADRLEIDLLATIERLEDLSTPLEQIGMLERDRAVEKIKIGGDPPWPPSKKTLGGSFMVMDPGPWGEKMGLERGDVATRGGYGQTGVDEGTMMRAMDSPEAVDVEPTRVLIGINVRTPDGRYNYARIFQEGSGVYAGHSEWTIQGDPILAWQIGGTWVYARSVREPGQPPRPFLTIAGTEEQVVAIIREWIGEPLGGSS